MAKAVPNAFTLIELLVVVAIMAIVSVVTISNYKSFGEDQNLKSAVLDIQSLLRQAQTSAIANAKCNENFTALWQVDFAGTLSSPVITLKCTTSSTLQKPPLNIAPNIEISSISGSGCPTTLPFTLNLGLLKGNIDIVGFASCASLNITLRNTKTNNTKTIIIEQGGRVYEPVPSPSS